MVFPIRKSINTLELDTGSSPGYQRSSQTPSSQYLTGNGSCTWLSHTLIGTFFHPHTSTYHCTPLCGPLWHPQGVVGKWGSLTTRIFLYPAASGRWQLTFSGSQGSHHYLPGIMMPCKQCMFDRQKTTHHLPSRLLAFTPTKGWRILGVGSS